MSNDSTNPWVLEPVWQDYSSMYREAITARDAKTGMEIAHHRKAALYFGVSTLESFLNLQLARKLLDDGQDHDDIYEVLRKGSLKTKIKDWPIRITGRTPKLRSGTLERLLTLNDLRGHLTHQKNFWPEAYEELQQTDPMEIMDIVAEFIISVHEAQGTMFPYWVWGWNYLNPRPDSHQIILINNIQFMHSLRGLGYKFDPEIGHDIEKKQISITSDYAGYAKVASFLESCSRCEPKWDRFPYQPKLCRRWWDEDHHRTCGSVTQDAIRRALEIDTLYGQQPGTGTPKSIKTRHLGWLSRMFSRLRS